MPLLFPPADPVLVPIEGRGDMPVHRIFCVGRNYAAHAAEMGGEVDREAPFYFTKSAHAVIPSGATLPYPPGTADLHHEVELVVAIGSDIFKGEGAEGAVLGYGCGLDMTRRDLQAAAKEKRRPWDLGKDFEGAAVLGPLIDAAGWQPRFQAITLSVNGTSRQEGKLSDMVWSVPEILNDLSHYYHLRPGDVIMMGTPAGVGAVEPEDVLEGQISGLQPVSLTISDPE